MNKSAISKEEQNTMSTAGMDAEEFVRVIEAMLQAGKGVVLELDPEGNVLIFSQTVEEVI